MAKKKYTEERKQVSRLIYTVLTECSSVKNAILNFPKGVDDPSVKAAYHALVHFEADEDLKKRDLNYKEEQDDFLEFIAQILQTGEPLPKNIIKNYEKYYKDINTPQSNGMKGLIKSLCKFLNV